MNTNDFKKLQQKHYKDMTEREDIDRRRATKNHYKKIKAISDFLDIQDGDNVLEVGVGTGLHAQRFLEINSDKKFSFTGIDLSEDLLEITKKKLVVNNDVKILQMDAENLGFEDETFDKIYIGSTLHHLPTPENGLKEMIRVLKKGGKLAIMEPHYIHPKNIYFCHSREAEKNMRFIQKKYFNRWLSNYKNINYKIHNFIYTPVWPGFMQPVWNIVEKVAPRIPILKEFSIMLFVTVEKR